MHELSIVTGIVSTMTDYMAENALTEISEIILEVGELSDVIPEYLEACYPIATEDTVLENTKLTVERHISHAKCRDCGETYEYVKHYGQCPYCQSLKKDVLDGKEFFISKIVAR